MTEKERTAILSESEHFDAYVDSGQFEKDGGIQNYSQGFRDAWNAAIAYAKREQQWVPVSERLPERGQRVLLTTFYGLAVFEGHRSKYGRDRFIVPTSQGDSYYKFEHITAWRPLPEPYQPKTDGDKAEGE